jgi:alkyl hydroperoxide reductase subunit AhpC
MLLDHHREVDGLAVEPWRRAGLQPPDRQLQLAQARRQRNRGRIAHATAGVVRQADVNQPVEESAGGQDDGARSKAHPELGHHAGDAIAVEHQVVTGLREERQIRLVLEAAANRLPIQHAICLRTRRAHRRALARIENAELDAGFVGGAAMAPPSASTSLTRCPLPMPPIDGLQLIAPERFEVVREQQRLASHARGWQAPPRCRHGRHRRRSRRNGQERAWAIRIPRTAVRDREMINTRRIKPFKATAFHNGKFVPVSDADLKGKWSVVVLLPGRLHLRLPDRTRRPGRRIRAVPEDRRRGLLGVDRHALHAQGLARRVGHDQEDQVPDDRRPDRHTITRNFDVMIEEEGLALRGTFVINPEGVIKVCEIHDLGIGRDAKELLRKVQAAQYVASHPGEVCPAKWTPGDATLAPSLDLVGKI